MDIEEFVQDVLAQVTRAVNDNKSGGKTTYHVDTKDGVAFDLAVTTAEKTSKEKGVSGGMKVKVVGAQGNKSTTEETSVEHSSRVKFKVDVWTESEADNVITEDSYFQ